MVQMATYSGRPLAAPLTGRAAVTSSVSRRLVVEVLELPPRFLPSPWGFRKNDAHANGMKNDKHLMLVKVTNAIFSKTYIFGCHLLLYITKNLPSIVLDSRFYWPYISYFLLHVLAALRIWTTIYQYHHFISFFPMFSTPWLLFLWFLAFKLLPLTFPDCSHGLFWGRFPCRFRRWCRSWFPKTWWCQFLCTQVTMLMWFTFHMAHMASFTTETTKFRWSLLVRASLSGTSHGVTPTFARLASSDVGASNLISEPKIAAR